MGGTIDMARVSKHAVAGVAAVRRTGGTRSDKGSSYFEIVRRLSNDPELRKIADEAEAKAAGKDTQRPTR